MTELALQALFIDCYPTALCLHLKIVGLDYKHKRSNNNFDTCDVNLVNSTSSLIVVSMITAFEVACCRGIMDLMEANSPSPVIIV